MNVDLKFGLTKEFECSYLPEQQEKLLVAVDTRLKSEQGYDLLMSQGFRRSGDQVYRPYCDNCSACHSIRVIASQFKPSKSQKRLLKKNQHFEKRISTSVQENYYPLYEKYINTLHTDGSMYPANKPQYQTFLASQLVTQIFVELWHEDKLISVAVTDVLTHGLSAVYTFYDPDYRSNGLGVFSILKQIETSLEYQKTFLYLGYQIDECRKMNYKNRYFPHQRFVENNWIEVNK